VSARGAPRSGASSPSGSAAADQAAREEPEDSTDATKRLSNEQVEPQSQPVDAMELARGGEALMRSLDELNTANADLRRQMEVQVKEVSTLQLAGQSQQQLLREFERQAEQHRQAQEAVIEERVRKELGEREARQEKEELMARIHKMDGELRHVEGERDESRERIRELEERINNPANSPDARLERMKGLEMELGLVNQRFARETEAKKAAERVSAESRAQQQELKALLDQEAAQVKQLKKTVAEESELANFRQEICNDLQMRLKMQQSEADRKIMREKGKMEAVSRLEGILPRHFLVNALA